MTSKRGSRPSKKPVVPKKRGKKKTEPWTEARKKAFIISVLRGGMRRWPPQWECLKEASVGKKINKATGRLAEHYKCAECKEEFPAKELQKDHRSPVIDPEVGFVNWDIYIERLYCGKDNIQILCKPCHLEKSKRDRMMKKK